MYNVVFVFLYFCSLIAIFDASPLLTMRHISVTVRFQNIQFCKINTDTIEERFPPCVSGTAEIELTQTGGY